MPISVITARAGAALLTATLATAAAAEPLTLARAERLAIEQAPSLARARANAAAAGERIVPEGRLPDPQLILGLVNVPTTSYRLNQDDMTMSVIGLRQSFPPDRTLDARTRRAEQEHARENARAEGEQRQLRRAVRSAWYERYYAEQALRLLDTTRGLAARDLQAAEARYRAAQESPRAVLRARQALARVDERIPALQALAARTRAMLARWLGEAGHDPLPDELPALPPVPAFSPERHPEWLAAEAERGTARAEVDLARADYRPGWMLDLSVGYRRPMPDGTERSNMATVMVTLDLPLFRDKRQDRRLAERQTREAAARHDSEDKRRELEAQYHAMRAEHEALAARVRILEDRLLPAVRREAQVTLSGFARDQSDLREARMREFEAELELLRLRVELARVHTELLYLAGEQP
jgi:outer membrane protein TolC